MAKANPATGTSYYLPDGAPVPDEIPDGVRLVGPGAPAEDTSGAGLEDAPAPADATEEGEQPSPGNSSSASTDKQQSSDEPSLPSRRKPARTTEPRSSKDRAGSSSARSTGGSGRSTN